MKIFICLLGLVLALPAGAAPGGRQTPLAPADPAPASERSLMGTLQQRVAIGGETTGWMLRYDKDQRVDLLLPIDAFAWIRDGRVVVVKGRFETRQYPERGAVQVFVVREISPVVT